MRKPLQKPDKRRIRLNLYSRKILKPMNVPKHKNRNSTFFALALIAVQRICRAGFHQRELRSGEIAGGETPKKTFGDVFGAETERAIEEFLRG